MMSDDYLAWFKIWLLILCGVSIVFALSVLACLKVTFI